MKAVTAIMPDGVQPVFGFSTVQGVNKVLQRASKRARLDYLSSHQIGRHTFAARLLNAGYDIKTVKEAGRWKKLAIVDERYGHLEQRGGPRRHAIRVKSCKIRVVHASP
jgi:integrase